MDVMWIMWAVLKLCKLWWILHSRLPGGPWVNDDVNNWQTVFNVCKDIQTKAYVLIKRYTVAECKYSDM